jgi:cAMP-specific phosphodiesterase 4
MLLPTHPSGSSGAAARDDVPLSLRILLVDDDALIRQLVSRQLSIFGHQTTAVEDGHKALSELAANHFHLLLTDWQMNELDGCDLVREVRKQGHQLPIILCSGWLDYATVPDDVASEISALLQKPARADELMLAIWNAV